jgi:pyruvate dehydrogenase E1 component
MGGAVWRKHLMDDLGDQGDVTALIESRSDRELAELMENLGGNCVSTMADAFASIDHDRPVCFLAYTIKGWGTPIAGHKDNHGGLMNKAQMAEWQRHMGVPEGEEWEKFATVKDPDALQAFLDRTPFFAKGRRRYSDACHRHAADRDRDRPRDLDADGVRQDPRRSVEDRQRARRADRDHLAGCDRNHQSRPLGQPAQAVCPGGPCRHVQDA